MIGLGFQMKTHWLLYLVKMDKLLEESFRLCVVSSLKNLLDLIVGEKAGGPSNLLLVSAFLKDNKVHRLYATHILVWEFFFEKFVFDHNRLFNIPRLIGFLN